MADATAEKQLSDKAGTTFRFYKKLKGLVDRAKEKLKEVRTECTDYIEAGLALASNYIENYPGKEKVEERIDKIINKVASKINLPTKAETEKLSVSIDLLTCEIEAMFKK